MLRLNEQQIDRIIHYRRFNLFFGLAMMVLPVLLPSGWAFGLFSGFMLFSLGIYGFAFRKWRTEPGLWMLAIFLTVSLGPCWLYFEFLHWRGLFARPVGRPISLNEVKLAIDATVALFLFAHTIKFARSVAIENWHRTRIAERTIEALTKQLDESEL